jgi:hypothetical protein
MAKARTSAPGKRSPSQSEWPGLSGYVHFRENQIIACSTRIADTLPALYRSAGTIHLPEKAVLNLSVNCV